MERLLIPDTIKVGYQERNGTYTGKLAYVIYYDEKGKLRKETSWQNWRDRNINPDEFKNEPTEGFVLNKGVGGARESWGWNTRNEYIRVFDPRGFEFEISVANLLFILQECNSIKGKGLEGQFVYSWEGTELVLLPTNCFEYKQSSEFTSNKSKKIAKEDMLPGRRYLDKRGEELLYLGREKVRTNNSFGWGKESFSEYAADFLHPPTTFKHVFYHEKHNNFEFHPGFTKLALMLSDTVDGEFPNIHARLMASSYVSHIVAGKMVAKKIETSFSGLFNHNGQWYLGRVNRGYDYHTKIKYLEYNKRSCRVLHEQPLMEHGCDGLARWVDSMSLPDKQYGYYNHSSDVVKILPTDTFETYVCVMVLESGETMEVRIHHAY